MQKQAFLQHDLNHAKLYAPDGTPIIGTPVTSRGIATITDITPRPEGGFDFRWSGEIEYRTTNMVELDATCDEVFIDAEGARWSKRDLKVVP